MMMKMKMKMMKMKMKMTKMNENPDRRGRIRATAIANHRPNKVDNILAPVEVQCQWLRESDFVDVDCFFKVFQLALFGGKKPE